MKKILILLVAIFIVGCSSSYKQESTSKPLMKLHAKKSVLIAVPANGNFDDKYYKESGIQTAKATLEAFKHHTKHVSIVESCRSVDCLSASDAKSAYYFVVPEILHWEDRNTEWSGKKDKIAIRITVYDAASLEIISSTTLSGKSKWATFGGDHPQDLLPEPVKSYVDSLY